MKIDSGCLVSISDANQNFSKVARLVDERGLVIILKNNKPHYIIVDYDYATHQNALATIKATASSVISSLENSEDNMVNGQKELLDCCKKVYEKRLSEDDAVKALVNNAIYSNETSQRYCFAIYRSFMGEMPIRRTTNISMFNAFLEGIYNDFGVNKLHNSLQLMQEHIAYYYKQTLANKGKGQKLRGVANMCSKIASKYGINIAFNDSLYKA